MNKGLLAWNIVLSLLVGFLLFKQFGSGKSRSQTTKTSGSDSSHFNGDFRMAYFEMDTIAANFDLVKELKSELSKREDQMNAEMSNRNRQMQEKYNYYQNLALNGKLSETESEQAKQVLGKMKEEMDNRKQQLDQDYSSYMVTKQNEIKAKIEDFLKEYNKEKNFSYIVSYEQGLFYYKDTAYNITADVVRGLNSKYKSGKK
jgi:outer membrane protein